MAVPVLRHRIVPNFNAEADGVNAVDLIDRLLSNGSA
jgi:MoxR-like ATPase